MSVQATGSRSSRGPPTGHWGLPYLFVSHDMAVVEPHSPYRIAVICAVRIVEIGAARAVLSDPRHPYTRQAHRRPSPRSRSAASPSRWRPTRVPSTPHSGRVGVAAAGLAGAWGRSPRRAGGARMSFRSGLVPRGGSGRNRARSLRHPRSHRPEGARPSAGRAMPASCRTRAGRARDGLRPRLSDQAGLHGRAHPRPCRWPAHRP